jgi:UV DNA damage endonuclease
VSVPALRLGFPVKVLGKPGLKSNDTRRWQQSPHLRVSLAYVRDIFAYLKERDIMYRLSSDLAPYLTHPQMPQFRTSEKLFCCHRCSRPRGLQ